MLEEHHLGKETFTHWPDGTAHKNRMQGNDYVQSQMSVKGVRCYACHDVHGTPNEADLRLPATRSASSATVRSFSRARAARSSSTPSTRPTARAASASRATCRLIARTVGNVSVRSHTFKFISPVTTKQARRAEPVHVVPHRSHRRTGRSTP